MEESLEIQMEKLWQRSVEEVATSRVRGLVEVPQETSDMALSRWMSREIQKITRQIDRMEEETGVHCVCEKGCDACCKQAIQVLPTEAKAIAAYMSYFAPEVKEELKQKIDYWKARIEASGLDTDQNKYYTSGIAEKDIYEFMASYFKLELPCPMLSEEGACMIYPVRPGGCWSYRVYSNPEDCKKSFYTEGGMKHDEWERYLLDHLFSKVPSDHQMKLLPYYIEDILESML